MILLEASHKYVLKIVSLLRKSEDRLHVSMNFHLIFEILLSVYTIFAAK